MTFLAIDTGNTRLKWALFDAARPDARLIEHGAVFLETIDDLADTQWRELPAPVRMLGCVVAGQAVRRRVEQQLEMWDLDPCWISAQERGAGVINGYDHPVRLGSDRWAALVGARHRVLSRGVAKPALVVMVGTAVTVDVLDAHGAFLGGLILPGFGLMLKALESGTAGLRVPTGDVCVFPTNTSDALMSGGSYAIAGAIERMHRHILEHCHAEPALFMAGGAAVKLAPITHLPFEVIDSLLFEGLLCLAQERWRT